MYTHEEVDVFLSAEYYLYYGGEDFNDYGTLIEDFVLLYPAEIVE